jgi:phage gp29-like protein
MEFNDAELEAYLDESLDAARAAELELAVRSDPQLLKRLSQINGRRDAGIHTIGEIWRRNQIGVPSHEEVQAHLAGKLSAEESEYIEFRIKELKCVFTIAMLQDAKSQQRADSTDSKRLQRKIYESGTELLERRSRRKKT